MRKALTLLIVTALFFMISVAQAADKPEWVETFDPCVKYPAGKYLVGFGTSAGKNAEAYQIAQDDARADVSSTIVVDIKSLLRTVTEDVNEELSQHLSSITQSSTAIELIGLKTETYGDDNPPTVYALAYVSMSDLKRIYSKTKADLRDQIQKIISQAQADESNSKNMDAVTKYLSLYPLYEQLKEAETILLVVERASDSSTKVEDAFAELERGLSEKSPDPAEKPLMSWAEVASKIDQLLSQPQRSVDDVARSVVIQLSKQAGKMSGKILIVPFTYQDTKMTSSFARYFRSALENQMGLMANLNWDIVTEAVGFEPKSKQIMTDLAKASGAQWLLSGTYWEQGDKIKLMAALRDVVSGKVLAGAEVIFDAAILKPANLDSKPQNFRQALVEQNAFSEDEIVTCKYQVEMWTNKGDQNLLFSEDEIMKVYVRVNRPSYIRLLYILANGRRTLLYDNYYIDQSKVNRVVEIPEEFECAPPYGSEMMVVVARTQEFEPLETVEVDGFEYLEADSPKEAAIKTKGMRRKQKSDEIQQSEAKLVITTMGK